MTKELAMISKEKIREKIYTIRGLRVMLDKDLAELYEVKTIRLREQVKRNRKRFPGDFMFQLTGDEVNILVSQNAIPSRRNFGGFLPYVFTEQGIANISSVLTNDKAIEVNIRIIRTFVEMRRFLQLNQVLFNRMNAVEHNQSMY